MLVGLVAPLAFACSSTSGTSSSGNDGSAGSGSSGSSSGDSSTSGSSSGASSGSGSSSGAPTDSGSTSDAGPEICGTTPCDLKTHICCVGADISGNATGQCVAKTASCPSLTAAFGCLSAADCTTSGQVCCGQGNNPPGGIPSAATSCAAVAHGTPCPYAGPSTGGAAQLCQLDSECTNGQKCIAQKCNCNASGCANLTLCGLQTSNGFNCK